MSKRADRYHTSKQAVLLRILDKEWKQEVKR